MHRLLATTLLLVLPLVFGQESKPGSKVDDFNITDLEGRSVSYSSLKGEVTVVLFIATQCPISNGYNERMKAVYKDYSAKGVKFVFINSNSTEPAAEVAEHAKKNGFAFPVFKDANNVVADRFNAQVTPEAFVMDSSGTIRYRGYIDDSLNATRVQKQGLRTALDAVLAKQAVPSAETKAFGCTIKRRKSRS